MAESIVIRDLRARRGIHIGHRTVAEGEVLTRLQFRSEDDARFFIAHLRWSAFELVATDAQPGPPAKPKGNGLEIAAQAAEEKAVAAEAKAEKDEAVAEAAARAFDDAKALHAAAVEKANESAKSAKKAEPGAPKHAAQRQAKDDQDAAKELAKDAEKAKGAKGITAQESARSRAFATAARTDAINAAKKAAPAEVTPAPTDA